MRASGATLNPTPMERRVQQRRFAPPLGQPLILISSAAPSMFDMTTMNGRERLM